MEKVWSFLKISHKAFSHVGDGKPPRFQISYGMLIVAGKKCNDIPHWVHEHYLHYSVAKPHELILWELLLGGVSFPRRGGFAIHKTPRGSYMVMVIGEKRLLEDHSEETQKGQMSFIEGGKG